MRGCDSRNPISSSKPRYVSIMDVPRVRYEFVWRQLIDANAISEDHGNVAHRD